MTKNHEIASLYLLIDQIILEARQMLIRKDQPAPVQTTSVIDQTVVHRCKHIYIQPGKIQLLELHSALISFIKIDT